MQPRSVGAGVTCTTPPANQLRRRDGTLVSLTTGPRAPAAAGNVQLISSSSADLRQRPAMRVTAGLICPIADFEADSYLEVANPGLEPTWRGDPFDEPYVSAAAHSGKYSAWTASLRPR